MYPDNMVNENNYDVLIGDITEKTLFTSLSDQLGVPYLSSVDIQFRPEWPVKGVVFGPNKRVFVNLITTKERSVNVFFLVDITCPITFVSPAAMAKLNPAGERGGTHYHIHGTQVDVSMSPQTSHFADLNVLGRNFFRERHHKLLVDYPSQTCTLFNGAYYYHDFL